MLDNTIINQTDSLVELRANIPLRDKVSYLHRVISERYPSIDRLAVAVYDSKSDLLKTFVHSSDEENPLSHYQCELSNVPTLLEVRKSGKARIINDLAVFASNESEHSRRLRASGFGSSYTLPMFQGNDFYGFIFFNSHQRQAMLPEVLHYLDLYGHLLGLTVVHELNRLTTLQGAVNTVRDITRHRDNETGSHLDRMSRYTRLIATELADSHTLDDEFIEHIFIYAPLHDIGKIAIPDNILLKPGRLTDAEFDVMKTHAAKGSEMIDCLLDHFGLCDMHHIDILRNIALYHHERLDGNGYPRGLAGEEIPLEARIVAVADIFDALTSERPYKKAWDNQRAFDQLREMCNHHLDPECVEALIRNQEEIVDIQRCFASRDDDIDEPLPGCPSTSPPPPL